MNIATMFVRLDGDASGVTKATRQASGALDGMAQSANRASANASRGFLGLDSSLKKSTFGMGRLNNTMIVLTRQTLNVHPAVGQLTDVLGTLAIGTVLMSGVLAGVYALTLAWQRLTKAGREVAVAAKEAGERIAAMRAERAKTATTEIDALLEDLQAGVALAEERVRAAEVAYNASAPGLVQLSAGKRLESLKTDLATQTKLLTDAEAERGDIVTEAADEAAEKADAAREKELSKLQTFVDRVRRLREEAAKISSDLAGGLTDSGLNQRINSIQGMRSAPGAEAIRRQQGMLLRSQGGLNLNPVTAFGGGSQITANASGGGGFLGQLFGGLKAQVMGLAASFGPLALAAAAMKPVLEGVMEVLGPAIQAIGEPLAALGRMIGTQLKPAFMFLAAILGQAVRALSYLTEGIGYLLKAIGWLVDKINIFGGDGGIGKFGQELIDSAKAARANASATDEATAAVQKFSSSMSNVPTVFANALRRFQSSTAGVPGGTSFIERIRNGGARPTGGVQITGPVTVVANNPEEFARQMEDYGTKVEWRSGYSRWNPALGY